MRYDKVIDLIAIAYTQDDIGQEVEKLTSRRVFANTWFLSPTKYDQTEVEASGAGRVGLRDERQFSVRTIEYQGETRLAESGVAYQIVKVDVRGEWTRLLCQRLVSNG